MSFAADKINNPKTDSLFLYLIAMIVSFAAIVGAGSYYFLKKQNDQTV